VGAGRGANQGVTVTAGGQSNSPAAGILSYAAPTITGVTGCPLPVSAVKTGDCPTNPTVNWITITGTVSVCWLAACPLTLRRFLLLQSFGATVTAQTTVKIGANFCTNVTMLSAHSQLKCLQPAGESPDHVIHRQCCFIRFVPQAMVRILPSRSA
jgi:hypothetical protein